MYLYWAYEWIGAVTQDSEFLLFYSIPLLFFVYLIVAVYTSICGRFYLMPLLIPLSFLWVVTYETLYDVMTDSRPTELKRFERWLHEYSEFYMSWLLVLVVMLVPFSVLLYLRRGKFGDKWKSVAAVGFVILVAVTVEHRLEKKHVWRHSLMYDLARQKKLPLSNDYYGGYLANIAQNYHWKRSYFELACEKRNFEAAKRLWDLGSRPKGYKRGDGRPVLHYLVRIQAPTNLIALVLDEGAEVDAATAVSTGEGRGASGGETALMMAVAQGNIDTAQLLLERGASPDKEDASGLSARERVMRQQDTEKMKPFVELLGKY